MFGRRRKRNSEAGEIDLKPAMNLILIIIPLLLMAMETAKIAIIEVQTPSTGPSPDIKDQPLPQVEQLNLTAAFTDRGIILYAEGKLIENKSDPLAPTIPKIDGAASGFPGQKVYDWAAFVRQLHDIKQAHPAEKTIIINAESTVKYRDIIKAMDMARDSVQEGKKTELFPEAVLGAGVA